MIEPCSSVVPPVALAAQGATVPNGKPQFILDAIARETGPMFWGLPERWLDANPVLWRCANGHVSTWYIKSEEKGLDLCPACESQVWMTFPEDQDDPSTNH